MDVAQNLKVWTEDPAPQPQPANPRGRPATRAHAGAATARAESVAALSAAHFAKESRPLTVRELKPLLGLPYGSTVSNVLTRLHAKGKIARRLRQITPGDAVYEYWTKP